MRTAPVTVIIPTYLASETDGVRFRRALRSLVKQKLAPAEVLILDDHGPFGPEAYLDAAEGLPVRILRLPARSGGPAAPRNQGAREATQPWLAFLDQDDWWEEGKLLRQMEAVSENPGCQVFHTDTVLHDPRVPEGERLPLLSEQVPLFSGEASVGAMLDGFIILSSLLIHRNLFSEMDGLRVEATPCDDLEFFLRLGLRKAKIHCIRQPLTHYERHTGNLSLQRRRLWEKKAEVFRGIAIQCGENKSEAHRLRAAWLHALRISLYLAWDEEDFVGAEAMRKTLCEEHGLRARDRLQAGVLRLLGRQGFTFLRKSLARLRGAAYHRPNRQS